MSQSCYRMILVDQRVLRPGKPGKIYFLSSILLLLFDTPLKAKSCYAYLSKSLCKYVKYIKCNSPFSVGICDFHVYVSTVYFKVAKFFLELFQTGNIYSKFVLHK